MKILFFILIVLSIRSYCCAPVWLEDSPRVQISGEKSLIVWDEENKKEHFFRSIGFQGAAATNGFIVPMPSVPEVADAADNLFTELDDAIENERPIEWRFLELTKHAKLGALPPGGKGFDEMNLPRAPPPSVKVVAEYTLANYEVKVIEAQSLAPLKEWLEEHKFSSRSELNDWLQSYIDQKWVFAVFIFRPENQSQSFETKTVRLSFKTDKPVYPYKEPKEDLDPASRILNLYFLAKTQYEPEFLEESESKYWKGPEYSLKIRKPIRDIASTQTNPKWLTVWKDLTPTGQRMHRDLYFNPAITSVTRLPSPPKVIYIGHYVFWAVLGLIVFMVWFFIRFIRKKWKR